MKIATWNINSVRARLESIDQWLDKAKPDVVCLQEIKCVTEAFPREVFENRGYNLAIVGQKSYNGVAIASLSPLEDITTALPELDETKYFEPETPLLQTQTDTQARYLEVVTQFGTRAMRIVCCYVPNGSPVGSEKFAYKLAWLERLREHVRGLLTFEEPLAVVGDTNIIPAESDAANIEQWRGGTLHHPDSLAQYRRLVNLGLTDPCHSFLTPENAYTYWDYQARARERNDGIRIDHMLLSPQATDCCTGFGVDDWVRDLTRPSDHVPVWAVFDSEMIA